LERKASFFTKGADLNKTVSDSEVCTASNIRDRCLSDELIFESRDWTFS
jgi:hypothetical protein